jgi:hypothetical protein
MIGFIAGAGIVVRSSIILVDFIRLCITLPAMPGFARRTVLRTLAAAVACGALLWALASAALYAAMRQTPARFGAIMSHVPTVAMIALPFKPLWLSARAGDLVVGDRAPDFALPVLHSDRVVKLSEEIRQKPVVLIFGSYT